MLFLGGPLYYFKGLQREFVRSLGLSHENAVFPDMGRYAVALGSALFAEKAGQPMTYEELVGRLEAAASESHAARYLEPLFENADDYAAFLNRHGKASVGRADLDAYEGDAYLGVDCGSTTTKLVLMAEDGRILYDYYSANRGNPVEIIREQLVKILARCGDRVTVRGSAATGYGEDLVKNAFSIDAGLVETMAHFKAARFFDPNVDFILDIGGQDIKCFKVRDNAIDSIMLNEACSSGCGSFIGTFAQSMGYSVEEFAKLGLFARYPVDLGSRCTVFMNSSVKQAQKDGATTGDFSAGLSVSIVKNAIYKVIRPSSLEDLGQHIVVQGGTFLNDAVLRAFERELGTHVVRPAIAGLMGAYGCALHAQSMAAPGQRSTLLGREALEGFTHQVRSVTCGLCENHCRLTVNTFADGTKYIGGNRCERPVTKKAVSDELNIYRFKQEYMKRLAPVPGMREKRIGIPLGLNMWEMAPFWHAFFTELGFETIVSPQSSRTTFLKGQASIPSDTVCFPAKLLHGHVEELLDMGVDAIYYPCMSFNFDEHLGDNHYNCPVVAYYPETIAANMTMRGGTVLINDYVGPHVRHDFPEKMTETLQKYFGGIRLKDVRRAADQAYAARDAYLAAVRQKGAEIIDRARAEGRRILCLAGRPYHADPEINHGIDLLLTSLGLAVISEDCLSDREKKFPVHVLNQWTYHARLYAAAKYIGTQKDMELVQLISFGCGLDAITSDECRAIVERAGKIYTQIKIDEITNLGTVKVRLRSLLAALEQKER